MPPPFYCEVIGQNIGVASPGGTGALQPLDAHIFRRQWTQTKSEAAEGVVSRDDLEPPPTILQITSATCKSSCKERSPLSSQNSRHNASPLCSQNSHRATTGDHVTIQNCHCATRAHSIMMSSSRRDNNLFQLFQTREARYNCRFSNSRVPLFDHNVLQVLRLPREMILSC